MRPTRYIAAIHPCTLLRMLDAAALPRAYRSRLEQIPNSYSAFTVYLKLKENRFPYINHTCYCQRAHGMAWQLGTYDELWPRGIMYMTPPVSGQGPFSRKMIITAPMPFDAVRRWEGTFTGRRRVRLRGLEGGAGRAGSGAHGADPPRIPGGGRRRSMRRVR